MPRPFKKIEAVTTADGQLELHQRGATDFMILDRGQVLMTSMLKRSEIELAQLACARLRQRSGERILISGLGMGFTLRAALDELSPTAQVVVAELNAVVVKWCRGPLAELTSHSLDDARVQVVVRDVGDVVREVSAQDQQPFDAIIWDLYRGPGGAASKRIDPLYDSASIERTRRALSRGGVFAVWGEAPDPSFTNRLLRGGFDAHCQLSSGKGNKHALYIAIKQ